jgi:hypothetical protein
MRATAKWIIGALAAVGTALLGGGPLTAIGKVHGAGPTALAFGGLVVAIAGVGWAIWHTTDALMPPLTTLAALDTAELAGLRTQIEADRTAFFGSFGVSVAELTAECHRQETIAANASKMLIAEPDETRQRQLSRAVAIAQANALQIRIRLRWLLELAHAWRVRNQLRRARLQAFAGAAATALGAMLFVAATTIGSSAAATPARTTPAPARATTAPARATTAPAATGRVAAVRGTPTGAGSFPTSASTPARNVCPVSAAAVSAQPPCFRIRRARGCGACARMRRAYESAGLAPPAAGEGGHSPSGFPISQRWPNGSSSRPSSQPCSSPTGPISVAPAATARSRTAPGSSTISRTLAVAPPTVSGLKLPCGGDSSSIQNRELPTASCATTSSSSSVPPNRYTSAAPKAAL